jgi:DNA-binding transcriptional LysR family regulator
VTPVLDADLLRTFLAIADTASFSAAAERVGRTPSAVSMQIKKLEESVGRRLFARDSRSVALTPFGEALLPDARKLLDMHAQLYARLRTPDLVGAITVGTPDEYASAFLPSVLQRFARTHPGVQVNVICDYSGRLRERLMRKEIDAALITAGEFETEGLTHRVVHEEKLVWLGARDGTAARRRPLPIAVANPECCWRARSLAALNASGVAHRVAYASASAAGQLAAVAGDLAVAPLPLCLANSNLAAIGADAGLPELGTYQIAFIARDEANEVVAALDDHVAGSFANAAPAALGEAA